MDDTPATRYLVGRMLRRAGYDVIEASTGAEAFLLAADGPDVVLLDVRLPDVSGFEVCRQLKAAPATRHVPVLLLSAAHTDGADKAAGLDGGADAYLTHPVEGPELSATVRALLRAADAEAELRHLAEALPQMVWTARPDGAVEGTNAHWLAYTGHSPIDTAGSGWQAALHPDDRAAALDRWARAVQTGEPYETESRLRRDDGAYCWHLARAVAMRDRDGRIVKWVGTWTDIDDARRAADAVRAANAALEAASVLAERAREEAERAREEAERARAAADVANRAKGEFLAVMSHELRTPLNAIGGYAELMEMGIRGPVTDHQREDLARIQRSQRALLSLINEVLNYARLETGTVTYDLTDVPVAEAVGAAEVLVAPQLRAKGLGYAWAGGDPGLTVRADRDKLQQVLLNLLSNAIKFTNARAGLPGRVEVSAEAMADGRAVLIRVHDTGVGIPTDKLEAIFEPFVQVDATLTRTTEGTGLGLAISRDLARGMSGDLTAESAPGVGSTFTLTLPAA